jgi:hypothetical protein
MGIFSGISNKISKRTQTGRTFKLGNKRVGSWKTPRAGDGRSTSGGEIRNRAPLTRVGVDFLLRYRRLGIPRTSTQ